MSCLSMEWEELCCRCFTDTLDHCMAERVPPTPNNTPINEGYPAIGLQATDDTVPVPVSQVAPVMYVPQGPPLMMPSHSLPISQAYSAGYMPVSMNEHNQPLSRMVRPQMIPPGNFVTRFVNPSANQVLYMANAGQGSQPVVVSQPVMVTQVATLPSTPAQSPASQVQTQSPPPNAQPSSVAPQQFEMTRNGNESAKPLNFVLRLRNSENILNDIKFPFTPGKDTPDGISHEMVSAGLVDGKDVIVVAANLRKIIDGYPKLSNVTFGLHPGSMPPNKLPEEANLIGFAQLSIVDT